MLTFLFEPKKEKKNILIIFGIKISSSISGFLQKNLNSFQNLELNELEFKKNMNDESIKNNPSDEKIDGQNKVAYLSVDIGTTNFKCSLYNQDLLAISSHCIKVFFLYSNEIY